MSESLFIRLLPYNDKAAALAKAILDLRTGLSNTTVYCAAPTSFRQVPGTPFAYWVSENIRRLFISLPKMESEGRNAQSGASTMNDFRFLRGWWEVEPKLAARNREVTFQGGRWVPFAKGGVYSSYYIDWELVIDWEHDGEVLKKEVSNYRGSRGWGYQWTAAINGYSFYFLPGITWPRRTQRGLSVRILPTGCIFGDKGPVIFSITDDSLPCLLGLANSIVFQGLVALQMAFGSYEVGVIERTPVPNLLESEDLKLSKLALSCVNMRRDLDRANEASHVFHLPALLLTMGNTLAARVAGWQRRVSEIEHRLTECQREIDEIAFRLYSIEGPDRLAIEESLRNVKSVTAGKIVEAEVEDEDSAIETSADSSSLVPDLLSYITGCVYGRWDIRFATGERPTPELPDPFAPLPVCSPGMLIGNDGLPLHGVPPEYPLNFNWEGILVDDPDHQSDIVRRVREVLGMIWKDNVEAIEREACQILGVKELREYFRRPGSDGFWTDHITRYSKSRRKAPIYWLLQSSKRNYALWLYYHRLDKDILFKALTKYVEPKIRLEEGRLEQLRTQLEAAGSGGREARQLEKQLERQENLLAELYDFRDKLLRVADLNLEPDLNDGVVLNIAPLRELVPWSEAKKYWDELLAGKYEWSSISKQLRSKGVI